MEDVFDLDFLFLGGLVYFDPFSQEFDETDQSSLSQMVVVVGCLGLLIVGMLGWLLWKWVSRGAGNRGQFQSDYSYSNVE